MNELEHVRTTAATAPGRLAGNARCGRSAGNLVGRMAPIDLEQFRASGPRQRESREVDGREGAPAIGAHPEISEAIGAEGTYQVLWD